MSQSQASQLLVTSVNLRQHKITEDKNVSSYLAIGKLSLVCISSEVFRNGICHRQNIGQDGP